MEKDKETSLKEHYRNHILEYLTDTITACTVYENRVPEDLVDELNHLRKEAEKLTVKILNSNVESWKA